MLFRSDTLDYSGDALNMGSKVVIAAAGPVIRELGTELPSMLSLPDGFKNPRLVLPGIVAIEGPRASAERDTVPRSAFRVPRSDPPEIGQLCTTLPHQPSFPLFILVDDSDFVSRSLANFLWATFTRANPAADIHGVGSFVEQKHWGCTGPLVIDARTKPHHAPPLVADPAVAKRIDALATRRGPLAKWL